MPTARPATTAATAAARHGIMLSDVVTRLRPETDALNLAFVRQQHQRMVQVHRTKGPKTQIHVFVCPTRLALAKRLQSRTAFPTLWTG